MFPFQFLLNFSRPPKFNAEVQFTCSDRLGRELKNQKTSLFFPIFSSGVSLLNLRLLVDLREPVKKSTINLQQQVTRALLELIGKFEENASMDQFGIIFENFGRFFDNAPLLQPSLQKRISLEREKKSNTYLQQRLHEASLYFFVKFAKRAFNELFRK